jgi:acetyltransferase
MMASMKEAHPGARLQGVVIQPMVEQGQEVIIGGTRDAQFGPMVMFGLGGVEVEGLGDVAFALAPLSLSEAEALLASTWAGRRLAGVRGAAPADRQAAVAAILRVGQLLVDHPRIAEVEVNPLRVLAEGRGAMALDVRLRVTDSA